VAAVKARPRAEPGERFDIAVEHAMWAISSGFTPREVILSLNQALPVDPSWSDAIYALVYAQVAMERQAMSLVLRRTA